VPNEFKGKFRVEVSPNVGPFEVKTQEQWHTVTDFEALRRPPHVVPVPYCAAAPRLDGDLSEWRDVPFVPLPLEGGRPSSFRLCWREEGLYGAASVQDATPNAFPDDPLRRDSVHVYIEKDNAFSLDLTPETLHIAMMPAHGLRPGECSLSGFHAGEDVLLPEDVKARRALIQTYWKPTDEGYVIEFLITAKALRPAAMEPGTTLGLMLVLSDDGRILEYFRSQEDPIAWRRPYCWGVVRLER